MICRLSWFKDSNITKYSYTLILVSIVIGAIYLYDVILILTDCVPFINIKNFFLLLFVLLIAVGGNYFMIKLNEKPIVTENGISIPIDMADKELINKAWNRVFISWANITKMILDSTVVNQWDCTFVYKSGSEIKLSSQMGYSKDCLSNLIKLGDELKKKNIEVSISKTANQLVQEIKDKGSGC